MADISQELIIISNGRYGRDIRQAIYDALRKVNSGGGGGGGDLSDYYTKEEVDEKLTDYSTTEVMNQTIGAEQRETLRLVSLNYYNKTYIDENIPTNLTMTQTIGAAQNETLRLVDNTHYTKTQVDNLIASIDSMPHVVCTQAEYDAMTSHDAGTLYFVKGETSVTLYLGDLPVNTGGGSSQPSMNGNTTTLTDGPTSSINGTNEEE